MPTEAQVIAWITANWPSVAVGVSCAAIYVAAYLRLQEFLGRVTKMEKDLQNLLKDTIHLKNKLNRVVMRHCKKYPDEIQDLMNEENDE